MASTDAPAIAGFTPIELLGAGGFADVYLYEQQMPRRRVAIKVLRDRTLSAESRRVFEAEANTMAELSAHPYIVTVFAASTTVDGRPYIVMEYYPGPSLGRRYRQSPLPVDEALRIGIQVSGAVETAHRSGILHRDIKPANILTSAYDRPGLTDFGISVAKGEVAAVEGMSVPWSPPELLDEYGQVDERSDVYSLAATVYSMLAGRSPFEVPGGRNDAFTLTSRIHQDAPAALGRTDVPAALERVLQVALSKRPDRRPPSALELGRQLQEAEAALKLNHTPLDVLDVTPEPHRSAAVAGALGTDPDGTRYRAPRTIDADTRLRPSRAPSDDGTRLRPRSVDPALAPSSEPTAAGTSRSDESEPAAQAKGMRALVLGGAAIVALAAGGALLVGQLGSAEPQETATDAPQSVVDPNDEVSLEEPSDVSIKRAGSMATATWSRPPDWEDGDYYAYTVTGTDMPERAVRVDSEGPVTLKDVPADAQVCLGVVHRRDVFKSSIAQDCTP